MPTARMRSRSASHRSTVRSSGHHGPSTNSAESSGTSVTPGGASAGRRGSGRSEPFGTNTQFSPAANGPTGSRAGGGPYVVDAPAGSDNGRIMCGGLGSPNYSNASATTLSTAGASRLTPPEYDINWYTAAVSSRFNQRVRSEAPDVVIVSDLNVPGGSGELPPHRY